MRMRIDEDFLKDLARIDIPTLVMHGFRPDAYHHRCGTADCETYQGAHLVVEGGPHCITWTHSEIVNHELLFLLG